MPRRDGPLKGDRLIGEAGGLRVEIGLNEWDNIEKVKIVDPLAYFPDTPPGKSEEMTYELNRWEVLELIAALAKAANEL